MVRKYELLENDYIIMNIGERKKVKLFRIRALRPFNGIEYAQLGGYIEKEDNLDQEGTCWIDKDSIIAGDAKVTGSAKLISSHFSADLTITGEFVLNGVILENTQKLHRMVNFDHGTLYPNKFVIAIKDPFEVFDINDIKSRHLTFYRRADIMTVKYSKTDFIGGVEFTVSDAIYAYYDWVTKSYGASSQAFEFLDEMMSNEIYIAKTMLGF